MLSAAFRSVGAKAHALAQQAGRVPPAVALTWRRPGALAYLSSSQVAGHSDVTRRLHERVGAFAQGAVGHPATRPKAGQAVGDHADAGRGALSETGHEMFKAAADAATRPPQPGDLRRDDFLKEVVDPAALCQQMCAQQMAGGFFKTLDQVLSPFGPGVTKGIERVGLPPDSLVGEINAGDLGPGVWFAHNGHRYTATQAPGDLHKACLAELAEYMLGNAPWRAQDKPGASMPHLRNMKAACAMTLTEGIGIPHDDSGAGFRLLLALKVFQHMPLAEVKRFLLDAANDLQMGGAVVFDFAHPASTRLPGSHERLHSFKSFERVLRAVGLEIAELHVQCRSQGQRGQLVLPTQAVRPDREHGFVSCEAADHAAYVGWNDEALLRWSTVHMPRMQVHVSGALIKARDGCAPSH